MNMCASGSDDRVVRSSASGAVDSGLIPTQGQTNDFKICIHSFSASTLKGQCGEQAGKFTCCAVGKGTWRDFSILE